MDGETCAIQVGAHHNSGNKASRDGGLTTDGGAANVQISPGPPTHGSGTWQGIVGFSK